ncbi:hypothetical protein HII31_07118 [Pseudocercospora fuligena]|uniref:Uncharacterized protein n=1 Tax=Pseudocercospora fuligena TaxID=685502 RepID=A0A8H6RKA6_9PEZI|nr:hypothetical protein HII31_07118 [Pseudocercospora fuligena]
MRVQIVLTIAAFRSVASCTTSSLQSISYNSTNNMRSILTFAATIIALASTVSATVRGGQCGCNGLNNFRNQGAWGCVQLAGPNCVDQTQVCDAACGGSGYAYKKHNSNDRQCVCSYQDASQAPSCPAPGPPIRGGQCCSGLLNKCKSEGAWGCVQVDAAYCVDQTKGCDQACGGSGYAYRKHK